MVLGAAPSVALAQSASGDWPQFQGDASHSGARADAPAPPYAPAWTIRPGAKSGQHLSAPVVAGTSVFVTSPDALFAFDSSSGSERWQQPRDGPPVSPAVATIGSTEAVVSTTGRGADTSKVDAIDASNGRSLWKTPVALKDESRTGVTVDGGSGFVGDEGGNVYGIDLARGTLSWTAAAPGKFAGPLAVGGGVVVAVAAASDTSRSTTVVAFDESTGKQRWSVVPDAAASFASLASIVGGDAVVAFPDGEVLGLSLHDGTESWSARIPALVSPFVAPAVADGAVFLGDSSGGVHRVTPDGGERWIYEFNQPILRASPVAVASDVVVGFEDGSLGAVDAGTGHLVFRTPAAVAPVDGFALTADALVVVRSGTGRPTITGYANDASAPLLDEASPTVPVAGSLALGLALALAIGAVVFVPARALDARRRIEDPSTEEDGDGGRAPDEELT